MYEPPRTPLPVALALLAAITCACSGESETAESSGEARPNLLLLTLDTTRPDYISAYDDHGEETPNIDALAADGVRFEQAISASAVTPVSHATILTGRYPYDHGLRVLHAAGGFRLAEEVPTLAMQFKAAGYRTAAVHSAFPVSSYFGLTREFDYVDSFDGAMQGSDSSLTTWTVGQLQRPSNQSVLSSLRWIQEPDDRPFFLWLHLWDPHDTAILPPDEFMQTFEADSEGRYPTEQLYAQEIAYLDLNIGILVDGIRAAGLWDDTLTALIADHGEGLTDGVERHGWYSHRMLYREQIHVPLILRLPSSEANRGRVCPELVRSADLAPTVLDYCGIPIAGDLDGRSLRPLIEGSPDEPRTAYADQINAFDTNAGLVLKRPDAAFLFSVQVGPWKLVWRPHMRDRSELFNVAQDPGEQANLWNKELEIRTQLLEDLSERRPWVLQAFTPLEKAGSAAQGALSALGYGGMDETVGLTWTWTCPEHLSRNDPEDGRCADCGRALLPVTEWD